MSNIDKRALREVAKNAKELGNISRHTKAMVARLEFKEAVTPDAVLALLDELEAKDWMVAELLHIISRHTIELGWGEKPITLAELILSREGSGSDALDAISAAAAGKGEAS